MNGSRYATARCTRCRNVTGMGSLRMVSPDLLLCSRCVETVADEAGTAEGAATTPATRER